ncbi:hypothetical protein HanPSC8_Chr14g0642351 [Helianthus annuus]|nr:hypothetical protein HanPSC8_Chr14g0642351 [Helianthus annuus]
MLGLIRARLNSAQLSKYFNYEEPKLIEFIATKNQDEDPQLNNKTKETSHEYVSTNNDQHAEEVVHSSHLDHHNPGEIFCY